MVKGKTIYLADDDADDRLLLTEAIRSIDPDIQIIETENGLELPTVLQSQMVRNTSLVILDMNMPKMNGLETLINLRNSPALATLSVVMLSTSGNEEMMRIAKQLGADDCFVKPSTMDDLLNLSRQLILGSLGQ